MACRRFLLLALLLVAASLVQTDLVSAGHFNRNDFPKGFLFGASSAAYQYEGAAHLRGETVWDKFIHDFPDKITDGSNASVANDFYHRYKEDIKVMKEVGLDVFRFSISWARILPHGRLSKGVNKEGIAFYHSLINELIAHGIKPVVTLYHFDLPQALEDEYGGLLSPKFQQDFHDYADLCFHLYGDKVKHWITFNEPYVFIFLGYVLGNMPPARCSAWMNNGCPGGDSATEPYTAGHNVLLAHAKAVRLYQKKYQAAQKGEIGIALNVPWMYPDTNTIQDKRAAMRALDFMYGWFIHPVVYGDYPRTMRTLVRDRLPKFTAAETLLVKGSYNFIGLNYYTSYYVVHVPFSNKPAHLSFSSDSYTTMSSENTNGSAAGFPVGTSYSAPEGFEKILVYTKDHYKNPELYITENGMAFYNNRTVAESIKDPERITFYKAHLRAIEAAIRQGVDLKGFMAWSWLDTFEWNSGYTVGYGLNYVDFKNGLKRYLKESALWYKRFLAP
ncbi:beta-glucosidase 12-like [Diospyros lotus]|uniref:beta-glucosidase 12-like n=1 Tax=Diospyros lotus TaxID=55363 RepID=UPI002255A33D|nr:beta-glucosidase 12-like [Diospyros lotus]